MQGRCVIIVLTTKTADIIMYQIADGPHSMMPSVDNLLEEGGGEAVIRLMIPTLP